MNNQNLLPTHMQAALRPALFPRFGSDLLLGLLLLLITVLVGSAGWYARPEVQLDIGEPTDQTFIHGFYDREQLEVGSIRWASADARFWLPAVPGPTILNLRMVGRPDGSEVDLLVQRQKVATLNATGEQVRIYQVLVPGDLVSAGGRMDISLQADYAPTLSADDPRQLSVLIDRVRLESAGASLPPLAILIPVFCSLLLVAGMRIVGVPYHISWGIALLIGVGLAWGWGWERMWFGPFLRATFLGLLMLVLLFALLRQAVQRGSALKAQTLLGAFAVVSAVLAFYALYSDYWPDIWRYENLPLLLLPAGFALLLAQARWRQVALTFLLLSAGGFAFGMVLGVVRSDYGHDFHAIHEGVADHLLLGMPLYDLPAIQANPLSDLFKYPPTFAALFSPLAYMPFVPALYVWRLINTALLLLSAVLLLRAYQIPLRSWAGAGLLLLLFLLRPLPDTLRYGQMDIIVLAILSFGLYALRRGNYLQFGIGIGLGAMLKIYPVYLLGLAFVQRSWKAFLGAILAAVPIALLSLLILGWDVHLVFLNDVLSSTGVGTGWADNQTFNGFLNRLVNPGHIALEPDGGGIIKILTYIWCAVITLITAWLTRAGGGMRPDIGYGLWIVALLLVLPVAWMHYLAILLIPFFQAFVLADEREKGLSWPVLAAYSLAWMLIAQGNVWTFFDRQLRGPYWELLLSYKFYGLLLLYIAIAFSSRSKPATLDLATDTNPRPAMV